MRLTDVQIAAIREATAEVFGPEAQVWLFGSRVEDSKRGGDIDLLIRPGDPPPWPSMIGCSESFAFLEYSNAGWASAGSMSLSNTVQAPALSSKSLRKRE